MFNYYPYGAYSSDTQLLQLLLMLAAIVLPLLAQLYVKSTYARYARVPTRYADCTGAAVARRILDGNGLRSVRVECIEGTLTDHYDPAAGVVRLSREVYTGATLAAVGIAAHETGHAVQHAENYLPLRLRSAIIPATQIGSSIALPLCMLGYALSFPGLVSLGIVCFASMCVFQLATLPVEFNASRRALSTLDTFLSPEETEGAAKVLRAAALTYVAALLTAVLQLLRLVAIFGGRRRR